MKKFRFVIDLESTAIDPRDVTTIHCIALCDIDSGNTLVFGDQEHGADRPLNGIWKALEHAEAIIGHNIIGYDLPVLAKLMGMTWALGSEPGEMGHINGTPAHIWDTLVMSRTNKPDRRGGHSLKAWGKRLRNYKGDYEGPWDKSSPEMYEYCRQDTVVNRSVYNKLLDELDGVDYTVPYYIEHGIADIVSNHSSKIGFKIDRRKMAEAIKVFEREMAAARERAQPHLLPVPLSKKKDQAYYTPPKVQQLKNKKPSQSLLKWVAKHGGKIQDGRVRLYGQTRALPLPLKPVVSSLPGDIEDIWNIKVQLYNAGWVPTEWSMTDISWHAVEKRPKYDEEYYKSVTRYIEKLKTSSWVDHVLKDAKCSTIMEYQTKLLYDKRKRKVMVIKDPEIFIGPAKDLCPNLAKLGDKVSWVDDIAKYHTYKHRLSMLRGKTVGKGWSQNPRVLKEGWIDTPANTCGAGTSRFTHSLVCNVPRVTSLGGDWLRGILCCDDDEYLIGSDADGLEARVEGHYTWDYDDDKSYVRSLIAAKATSANDEPDVHQSTACKVFGVTMEEIVGPKKDLRDVAKGIKYGISYGAGVSKVASMVGGGQAEGQRVYDNFWRAAHPLAQVRELVMKEHEITGGVKLVDGRKVYPKSGHAALNYLFQGTGVLCAKLAGVWWWQQVQKEKLKATARIFYHDEFQVGVKQGTMVRKEFDTQDAALEFKAQATKLWSDLHEEDGKYVLYYDRVGELMAKSWTYASEFFQLNVKLTGGYSVGKSWADTH